VVGAVKRALSPPQLLLGEGCVDLLLGRIGFQSERAQSLLARHGFTARFVDCARHPGLTAPRALRALALAAL
jgi:hypothetical protein